MLAGTLVWYLVNHFSPLAHWCFLFLGSVLSFCSTPRAVNSYMNWRAESMSKAEEGMLGRLVTKLTQQNRPQCQVRHVDNTALHHPVRSMGRHQQLPQTSPPRQRVPELLPPAHTYPGGIGCQNQPTPPALPVVHWTGSPSPCIHWESPFCVSRHFVAGSGRCFHSAFWLAVHSDSHVTFTRPLIGAPLPVNLCKYPLMICAVHTCVRIDMHT